MGRFASRVNRTRVPPAEEIATVAHIGLWLAPGPGETVTLPAGLSGGQRVAGSQRCPEAGQDARAAFGDHLLHGQLD
jgi:hypothetical protein